VQPGRAVSFSKTACYECGRLQRCPDTVTPGPDGDVYVQAEHINKVWARCGSGGGKIKLISNGTQLPVELCNSRPSAGLLLIIILPSVGIAVALAVVTFRVLRRSFQPAIPYALPANSGSPSWAAKGAPSPTQPEVPLSPCGGVKGLPAVGNRAAAP
jgi:hypothetical protein